MGWLAEHRLKSLHSTDAGKRAHVVAWLGGKLEPERVVLLVESADDAEKAVRAQAIRSLATSGERLVWRVEQREGAAGSVDAIVERLLASVDDEAIDVRIEAVRALERIASAAVDCGRTGLIDAKLAARLLDPSEEVRWQVSALLEKISWVPQSDEEQGALDIAQRRWQATEAHVPALLNVLTADRSYYARTHAASLLGKAGDLRAFEPLRAALLGDVDDRVRAAAAGALGLIGGRRAVPDLIAALEDGDFIVRNRAAVDLAELEAGEAVDPLIALLGRDKNSTAVLALARLGDKRAVPAIALLLDDENKDVRRSAAEALERLGDSRGAEALALEQQREEALAAEQQRGKAARSDLLGLIILFSRDFEPRETFVNSILDRMQARGRAYRSWMAPDTALRVMTNANAQDPSAIAATGLIGFRSLLGIEPDLDKLEYATFEGSDGIWGSILSLWRT